jgi:hypothetical protein
MYLKQSLSIYYCIADNINKPLMRGRLWITTPAIYLPYMNRLLRYCDNDFLPSKLSSN